MYHEEREIIEGLKRGENRAYKHLYDRHYVVLCKIADSFLRDGFAAQNLVDDLIVNLYEKRETLLITTSLRAYLTRAVRNRCINHLQSERERREIGFSSLNVSDDRLTAVAASDDYPLVVLLERELENEINASIERMPDACRTVFEKSRYDGKSYEAIATEMNISVNTVKYHIKNALSHLKKDLGKYFLLIISCLDIFR